ncbi:flagellar hook-associated protein FlgL [Clostridium sp.]|uniref:flagellar hook-associated protein FlgL n=1 Tax=Clostridium sp. TaxID=1506 RepID=UPI001A4073AC|nr:flagellar hook-associated protein FlgL [Clostridium sp.]MBK5240382.1 flagellar hook-associated protein FlgL [Clostridium sp.]
MRVTNKMLSNNFLRDMRTNLTNLSRIQNQMSSGKQITKPSDDPAKASKIMQMYSEIDANKQYNSNIKNTTNWLDMTDETLDRIGGVVGRIDELLVSSGNAGYGNEQRQAVKDEVNQRVEELSNLLNTSFDGKYIFGGTRGTTKPTEIAPGGTYGKNSQLVYSMVGGGKLDITGVGATEYNQINSKVQVEVSQGVTMEYNVTASEVMNYGDNNLMELLGNITDHLDDSTVSELTGGDLEGIQKAMTNILKLRSQVGAKQNRMESAESRNVDANFNLTEILSATEDIDITETVMEYATMQNIYMASLQTSAKVIQPTLLDYL